MSKIRENYCDKDGGKRFLHYWKLKIIKNHFSLITGSNDPEEFEKQKSINVYVCYSIGCCGCCSALRPKYKSLVDNIFPANPEDGLVKSNMEKLTFYSLRSPEKLDRIGEYLYQKASKDINRKRYK